MARKRYTAEEIIGQLRTIEIELGKGLGVVEACRKLGITEQNCGIPIVTDNTSDLIRCALQGIRAIYRDRYLYKKAGVMLTGLVPASQTQADLFDDQDRGKSKRLMSALDAVNDRWGAGTLQYASSGITKAWRTKFHRRSPAYTTNWNALPVVTA